MDALLDRARDIYEGEIVSLPPTLSIHHTPKTPTTHHTDPNPTN